MNQVSSYSEMTKNFPLGLPINIVMWNPLDKQSAKIKTRTKSPGRNGKEKQIYVSEMLIQKQSQTAGANTSQINQSDIDSELHRQSVRYATCANCNHI